ncbi:MAG: cupin domain-containing protein [Clostridia bacterium]|nr:cupin domain-containing protein [Clostridia bacterium]
MKIVFDQLPVTHLVNFNGGEKELQANMVVDERNKILRGRLVPGASIGYHQHATSSEIIYILEGNGKTVTDGVEERVSAGECHYCEKGQFHTLINDSDTDLVFFAVVPQQ